MRALALVSLLVPLAVGGYLLSESMRSSGAAGKGGSPPVERASGEAAAASLQAARPALEAAHAATGSYTGVALPGVRLVRADSSSYCLEAGSGQAVQHLPGPGGSPAPGPCR